MGVGGGAHFMINKYGCYPYCTRFLTLLHSDWPKLHRVLAVLSAKGLMWKQLSKPWAENS